MGAENKERKRGFPLRDAPQLTVIRPTPCLQTLKGVLTLVQHPYLHPVTDIDFLEEQVVALTWVSPLHSAPLPRSPTLAPPPSQRTIIVMSPLSVKGSLKDLIYSVRPKRPVAQPSGASGPIPLTHPNPTPHLHPPRQSNPLHAWDKKYRGRGAPLPARRIAMIGRQIIEAIEFLRSKGLRYDNLHTGNIIMSDGVPR